MSVSFPLPGSWLDNMTVPRPLEWKERPDLVGQIVIPHTCNGREHNPNNDGCICEFIGKPVKIVGIYESMFVGTPSYLIEGSSKTIQELEFSDDTKGQDTDKVYGFILQNSEGKYLSAGFNWIKGVTPFDGYLHNNQVVQSLVDNNFPCGEPSRLYPATSTYDGATKVFGAPISFEEFKQLLNQS